MYKRQLIAVAILGAFMAPSLYAELPPVRDSIPLGAQNNSASRPQAQTWPVANASPQQRAPAGAGKGNLAELFMRLQRLEQEVASLRGQLEEQGHELKRLKQQRMDDYLDLDRRISGKGAAAPSNNGDDGNHSSSTGKPISAGERSSYKTAFGLLKQQKIEQARTAMLKHLDNYPDGSYAPNAYYWLGEIYLMQNQLEMARQRFASLLDKYPENRKVPDAKFKLGQVYFQMGDKVKAKRLLSEVAGSKTSAAAPARQYLKRHF